jgi:hypothetical protein
MKTLRAYVKGGLIGMTAEYCYRVELNYFAIIVLSVLIIEMAIEVVNDIITHLK